LSFAGQKPALHSDEGPISYRTFLDSLPFIMRLFDKQGRCLFQNKAALDYAGITQGDGLGSGWLECVHPDDRARMACERLESILPNEPRRIEHRLRRTDGEYRWFLATIVPVGGPGQSFMAYLISATDITDQKDKFDSLHQSEARYRHLFESNLIGVTFACVTGEILHANDAFLDMVGYSREDLQAGRLNWVTLTPSEYRLQTCAKIQEMMATGTFVPYQKEYIRKNGSRIQVQVASSLLDGSSTDCVTFIVDLSKLALLEERNRATTERAAELGKANRALKQTLDVLATENRIDEVLGHVLAVATQVLGGCGSLLWLRDVEQNTTHLHLFYQDQTLMPGSTSGHRLSGQEVSLDRKDLFVLSVFKLTQPMWHAVENSMTLSDEAKAYLKRQGVEALLGVPLIVGEQTIGVIIVRFAHMRDFGSIEIELAQGLAQQATLALQLTRLAEQARNAAVTEERNRMAREIHDTLAQSFTGILIQLQAAEQVLNGSQSESRVHLDSAIRLARAGLTEARRSVFALRPQLLQGGDIVHALNLLVKSLLGESPMKIGLSVSGSPPVMTSDMESNLLRIAQEAITNAIKHSGGAEIQVRLHIEPDVLKLIIEDDGAGFDPHVPALNRGFGLISMHERANRIGGELTILTQPGSGTKVHLLISLSHQKT
jgi:two-component system, NarL family, sensor kinase